MEHINKESREEIIALLGQEIKTVYGTCKVMGLVKIGDNEQFEYVKFEDEKGEEFFIELIGWNDVIY